MFKFLKNKIKDAVGKFSKSAEEEIEEIETVEEAQASEQEKVQDKPAVKQEQLPATSSEEKKDVLKTPVSKEAIQKESESKQETKEAETKKQQPAKEKQQQEKQKEKAQQQKEQKQQEEREEEQKEEQAPAREIKQETALEEQEYETLGRKKGFLGKLFGKKESEEQTTPTDELLTEQPVTSTPLPEETTSQNIISTQKEKEAEQATTQKTEQEAEQKAVDALLADEPSADEPLAEVTVQEKKEATHSKLLADADDSTKQKKGLFKKFRERVVKFQLTDEKFEELFWDFELALLENNVAMDVIEKIKKDLYTQLTQETVTRKGVEEIIIATLKESLSEILAVPSFDLLEKIKAKTKSNNAASVTKAEPFVICMVGVNGSGKTTTLAKIVHYFQQNNLSVVVAAADTFRAAAIQQLEEHTNKLGVKLIKHDYNADPAAVAFDAIKHATAKQLDVVLIDTAGRLQSNSNLMDELKKLIRVNKPDLNIFVGESITGNDCVEQAIAFNEAVGIDGIILSKADVDEKGGAALSVSYVTGKPILYLGTGQTYDDLEVFDKEKILENLGL